MVPARVFVATGDRRFHTKSAVVDGEIGFVSTYNLDLLSGKVNREGGAVVKSNGVAADLLHECDKDKADKSNRFLEYTIKKNPGGTAVLKDDKAIPTFSPDDHLPADVLAIYAKKMHAWGKLRDALPYLAPLRHPARLDGIDSEDKICRPQRQKPHHFAMAGLLYAWV